MVLFTGIKIDRSKLARKLYNNIGLPTVKNFNHMVSTNMISNFPITVANIINAENIYGPLMTSLKGNSMWENPRPLIKDDIKIPSELYIYKH